MARKVRISARSVPWLAALDDHVRRCDIKGPIERFRDVAADVFDSWALRRELDDLIKRKLLVVVEQGFDDSRGRDPLREGNPNLCGIGWSVNPAPRLVCALWPERTTLAVAPHDGKGGA